MHCKRYRASIDAAFEGAALWCVARSSAFRTKRLFIAQARIDDFVELIAQAQEFIRSNRESCHDLVPSETLLRVERYLGRST